MNRGVDSKGCELRKRMNGSSTISERKAIMKTSMASKFRNTALGLAAAVLLLPGLAAAAPAPTTTTLLQFSQNPVTEGTDVTITGTTTYDGSGLPVVGETLQIQMKQSTDTAYDPTLGVACDAAGTFKQVPPNNADTDANGQVSKLFPTTGLGGKTICFKANHPANGTVSGASHSGEINLIINAGTCTGVTLSNPSVSGGTVNGDGSVSGPWTITMRLTNCLGGDPIAFKVQGGANAWAPYNTNSVTKTSGDVEFKVNKKNTVLIWNVTTGATPQDITFTVGTSASTVPCGGIDGITQYLTGAWSAAYTDPDTNLPAKSDYTARATVTSGACQ